MTTTHIRNLAVVTLDEAGTIHPQADLVIGEGALLHVGEAPAEMEADETIDGSGKVALPGLVNSHCHAPMTFERGWAEDLPFDRWLNEKIWVQESVLTSDDVYWGAQLAACEMIRGGTVAFSDKYFHMDRVAEVVDDSGLKAALTWTVFGGADDAEHTGRDLAGTVEWIEDLKAAANPRIRSFLGPHSPYICPPDFLARVVELAHEHEQGIHLHLAETEEQVQASVAEHGARPVRHVDSLGLFDVPGGCVAAHCLAIDEVDTEILAQKGVYVPHCPITYMKLAMPIPPLTPRIEAGVRVCLGTDGPASNADLDMFATMRQTALIHKYQSLDPELMPGDMALRLATCKRALGFPERAELREGEPADFILVDLRAPHLRPLHDLVANLVHSAKAADVTDVMVDGRWLMRERELLTLDEERILYEADRRARAMVGKAMRQVREYRA